MILYCGKTTNMTKHCLPLNVQLFSHILTHGFVEGILQQIDSIWQNGKARVLNNLPTESIFARLV